MPQSKLNPTPQFQKSGANRRWIDAGPLVFRRWSTASTGEPRGPGSRSPRASVLPIILQSAFARSALPGTESPGRDDRERISVTALLLKADRALASGWPRPRHAGQPSAAREDRLDRRFSVRGRT